MWAFSDAVSFGQLPELSSWIRMRYTHPDLCFLWVTVSGLCTGVGDALDPYTEVRNAEAHRTVVG
jgi:hypothetical protein